MHMENRDLLSFRKVNITVTEINTSDFTPLTELITRGRKLYLWTFPVSQNKSIMPCLDMSHAIREVVAEAGISLKPTPQLVATFCCCLPTKQPLLNWFGNILELFLLCVCVFLFYNFLPGWLLRESSLRYDLNSNTIKLSSTAGITLKRKLSGSLLLPWSLFLHITASAPAKHSLSAKVAAATSGVIEGYFGLQSDASSLVVTITASTPREEKEGGLMSLCELCWGSKILCLRRGRRVEGGDETADCLLDALISQRSQQRKRRDESAALVETQTHKHGMG